MSLQEQWAMARDQRAAQNQSLLGRSRQQRLERHQALMAELSQQRQQRQQAMRQRTEQTRTHLCKLEQDRAVQRALDEYSRTETATQRAKSVADLLSSLGQERAAQSEAIQQELQAFRANLTLDVEGLLGSYSRARQTMADVTQQARQAFCADLQQQVQTLQQVAQQELAQMARERQVIAQALQSELAAFRIELHEQVWGNGIPFLTPEPEVKLEAQPEVPVSVAPPESSDETPELVPKPMLVASGTTSVEAAIPVTPSPEPQPQPPVASPAIPVIPPAPVTEAEEPGRILTYVNEYVDALQAQNPDLTLLQVIGNREQVRDLLARGAVDLGVDPSEILTTLRRMVSETVAV